MYHQMAAMAYRTFAAQRSLTKAPGAVNCFLINWVWSLADSDSHSQSDCPGETLARKLGVFKIPTSKLTDGEKNFLIVTYTVQSCGLIRSSTLASLRATPPAPVPAEL